MSNFFHTQAKNSSANTLFILSYNARHVLAVKSKSFEAVLSAILDHFPDTIRRKITLQTKELELCDGVYTEIPPCLWNHVMDEIKSVTVVAEDVVVQSGDLSLQALGSELPTYFK